MCKEAPTSKRHTCHGRGKLFPLRNLLICVTVFHALIIWTPTSWNFWHFLTLAARVAGTSPQFIYLFAFNTFRWPCLELVLAIRWFDLNSFAVKKFSAMFYVLRMRMAKRRTVGEGKGKETRQGSIETHFTFALRMKPPTHSYSRQVLLWIIYKHTSNVKMMVSPVQNDMTTTTAATTEEETQISFHENMITLNIFHCVTHSRLDATPSSDTFYLSSCSSSVKHLRDMPEWSKRDDVAGNRIHGAWGEKTVTSSY